MVASIIILSGFLQQPQDDSRSFPRWTFDTGLDGWSVISGTDSRVRRTKGIAGEALEWSYSASPGECHGVHVAVPPLGGDRSLRFRFHVQGEGIRGFLVTVRTRSGKSAHFPVTLPRKGWREVSISTEAFLLDGGCTLAPSEIADLMIWHEAAERIGRVRLCVDDFRIESDGDLPASKAMTLTPVAPHPKLAVHLDFATLPAASHRLPDRARLREGLKEARSLGFSILELPNSEWTDFEEADGKWNWTWMDVVADAAREADMKLVACAGGLLNVKYDGAVHVPRDLRFSGDFPGLLPRYLKYLDVLSARYGDVIRFFAIHSERCERYFADHPDRVDGYRTFLREAIAHLRRIAPDVRMGVCMIYTEKPELVRAFNEATDVVAVLFDPTGHTNVHTSYTADEFNRVLEIAGTKKIALNEAFRPSSPRIGSSEEEQAAFVREILGQLKAHDDRIEWATWWSLRDDDGELWAEIGKRIAGGAGPLAVWIREMATCGLLRRDGSAKPAAAAWVAGVRDLPRPNAKK